MYDDSVDSVGFVGFASVFPHSSKQIFNRFSTTPFIQ